MLMQEIGAKSQMQNRGGGKGKAKSAALRLVMIIGDEGAILVACKGNKVVRRLFSPSPQPEHMKTIIEFMEANQGSPLYILLDVIDQQYIKHSFPPVSSLSVNKLVNRRLQRDFPPEDIKGAIALGRETGGRKEWSYLLVALAKTPHLQIWLDLLLELPNECKGLYLTPAEGCYYVPQLMRAVAPSEKSTWQLLVSHNKVGGVRQIVLHNNKLVFTRLTQAGDDANYALTAGSIEQEVQNTLDYLRRLGFADNGDMAALLVVSQEVKDLIDLSRMGLGFAKSLTPYEVADAMNLEQAALAGDRYGDVVMAAAFAVSRKKSAPFMSHYGKQLAQLLSIRRAIKLISVVVVAACLFAIGSDIAAIFDSNSALDKAEIEAKISDTQTVDAQKTIDGFDRKTSLWSAVVSMYDAFLPEQNPPTEFVTKLAQFMTDDVRVSGMRFARPLTKDPVTGAALPVVAGAPTTPLSVAVDIEFVAGYRDQDQYIKAANEFYQQIQADMPEYNINAEGLPGRGQGAAKVEISFDQQSAPLPQGQKITLIFNGPNPVVGNGSAVQP
jgi:hypothetical protein